MRFLLVGLMCENWERILEKSEEHIDSTYVDSNGRTFTFIGLLHGSDDYYYCMVDKETGVVTLCSCVGSLTGEHSHGFTKL